MRPKVPEVLTDEETFLHALGMRVRSLRARRGLTRKRLAQVAEVSERHLANLEQGTGNASILILKQIAGALSCPLAELIGDETVSSPEWLLLRSLLAGRGERDLRRARSILAPLFGVAPETDLVRLRHIALVGLRGAGKSTLGAMLAEQLEVGFVEISTEIEKLAGGSVPEIQSLYGASAYHRYERRALEAALDHYPDAIITTPGSIVSEPSTFGVLLSRCYVVWIQASPQEHMQRVIAQGDLRPMGGAADSVEAMEDLKHILEGRAPLYGKADLKVDTTGLTVDEAFALLGAGVRAARTVLAERG
ncbi:MAG: helix-turn-helix domain-containing protein [Nevskiaceae bacterium]|nr:MAG: helix-turn-helix domain-containing protein [Nevskiaceae bacterium]TBR73461.1 MAG: helix-turn-helix domain-containing protein [Nevskiaceae bacterium]